MFPGLGARWAFETGNLNNNMELTLRPVIKNQLCSEERLFQIRELLKPMSPQNPKFILKLLAEENIILRFGDFFASERIENLPCFTKDPIGYDSLPHSFCYNHYESMDLLTHPFYEGVRR